MQPRLYTTFQSQSTDDAFAKTPRRYFGSPPVIDSSAMKKSSILFTSTRNDNGLNDNQNSGLAQQKCRLVGLEPRQKPLSNAKSGGMYSSVIMGKSSVTVQGNGFSTSNKVKQLNQRAEELKKKLLDISGSGQKAYEKSNDTKLDISVVNPNPFSKARKSEEIHNNMGKFTGLLNLMKSQNIIPSQSLTKAPKTFGFLTRENNTPKSTMSKTIRETTTNAVLCPSPPKKELSLVSNRSDRKQPRRQPTKDDFQMGKILGNGMFGEVILVRHKNLGFVCAMKVLKKSMIKENKVADQLVREIKIQSFLRHRNIVNLYGYFSDSECFYILQELCIDGHLFSKLKEKQRFNDSEAVDIIRQICDGLDYIHAQRIIHRDIKPQNIILHQGVAKICDFGWSVYRGEGLRTTFCGTPLYCPPELLKGESYDEKFDVWAIGILAYELLVGRFPFKIFCQDDIKRILTDQITFPFSVQVSPEAKNFILSIVRKDPRQRIVIEEVLGHHFLRKTIQLETPFNFRI